MTAGELTAQRSNQRGRPASASLRPQRVPGPAGTFRCADCPVYWVGRSVLYFARDVIVPIALAVLLSFLLAPAVRWLRRGHLGRVTAVTLTVLIAFLAMLGFVAIVVQEIPSLAKQLPEYRSNLEAKIRSLPGAVPGGGALRRATSMVQELGRELKQCESQSSISAPGRSAPGASMVEPPKPVPVEIQRPELEPLQVVQSIVGPLLLANYGAGDRVCRHDPA